MYALPCVKLLFILFSGEEIGFEGSAAYAKKAAENKEKIPGMINMDMIAWNDISDVKVFIGYKKSDPAFFNTFSSVSKKYITDIKCIDGSSSEWVNESDHKSFWENGFPNAIYLGDDLINKTHPYFHKITDVVGTSVNSKPTAEMFLKSAVVNIAELGIVYDNSSNINSGDIDKSKRSTIVFDNRTRRLRFLTSDYSGIVTVTVNSINGQFILEKKGAGIGS